MGKLTVLQVKALSEPGRYPDGDWLFLLVGVTGTIPNKVEAAYRRTDFLAKRRAMMAEWAAFCLGAPQQTTQG